MRTCMRSLSRNRWLLTGLLLLLLGSAFSVFGGTASVSSSALLSAFRDRAGASQTAALILYRIRIPRYLAGLGCGAALSVSGLFLREALRNPLASPGVMGMHNGAGLFALLPPAKGVAMIRIKGLRTGYGEEPFLTIDSLYFEKGRMATIVGKNGSGKSTLLRSISCLLPHKGKSWQRVKRWGASPTCRGSGSFPTCPSLSLVFPCGFPLW